MPKTRATKPQGNWSTLDEMWEQLYIGSYGTKLIAKSSADHRSSTIDTTTSMNNALVQTLSQWREFDIHRNDGDDSKTLELMPVILTVSALESSD